MHIRLWKTSRSRYKDLNEGLDSRNVWIYYPLRVSPITYAMTLTDRPHLGDPQFPHALL